MSILDASPEAVRMANKISEIEAVLKSIPEGKSASVNKSEFEYEDLRELCSAFSTDLDKFLVIDHKGSVLYEIHRCTTSLPVEACYSLLLSKKNSGDYNEAYSIAIDKLKEVMLAYSGKTAEDISRIYPINEAEKGQNLIYYAYLQRSCANLAAFRHIKGHSSSTEALKKVLRHLVDQGCLSIQNESPLMYKINGA